MKHSFTAAFQTFTNHSFIKIEDGNTLYNLAGTQNNIEAGKSELQRLPHRDEYIYSTAIKSACLKSSRKRKRQSRTVQKMSGGTDRATAHETLHKTKSEAWSIFADSVLY